MFLNALNVALYQFFMTYYKSLLRRNFGKIIDNTNLCVNIIFLYNFGNIYVYVCIVTFYA